MQKFSQDNMQSSRPSLTPDMIKMSKTLTCSCGGMLFREATVFKKISAIISPTGKEELMPIEVVVCEKCNLVNREMIRHDVLPEEIMEKKLIELNTGTTSVGVK